MKIGILLALMFTSIHGFGQPLASIVSRESRQHKFATTQITKSLIQRGFKVTLNAELAKNSTSQKLQIILATARDAQWLKSITNVVVTFSDSLQSEGYSIQSIADKGTKTFFVLGKDEAGVMYGGLELAELIRLKGVDSVKNVVQNPYLKKRGVKMNIPLDVRTPSYTDMSDAAQENISEMWSMEFWKEYLDSLASYRFNFVSLWSLHPFPSMVKVPEYPDIALNDVHRSKAKFQEYYSTRATGFDTPEIVNNYEVVKKISIDEKMKFWQEVMQYGKDRNINFYIVTWNIYTCGTFGQYGITDDVKNPITIDYFRKSIKQLFLTYPLLAGIGLTTGENMPGTDFQAKEDWSYETYGQGVLDAAKLQPDRKITLIHRQHEAGALDIVKKFTPLFENKNINFVFSFKYAQAHVYSSTMQVHHHEFAKQIQSRENLKTLWTLRNDDVYYFRWGAPDFVREFIKNIPIDITEGYYYGSDQYVWGREFLDINQKDKREIEIAKHWYQWMLWGRLGYDPELPNDRFIEYIHARYPNANAGHFFDAWQSASMIYPLTTGFHYGALDFQWYIEASKSRPEPAQTPSGYHDINRFITLPPYKGTDFISIPDFVKSKMSNTPIKGTSPLEVADKLHAASDNALKVLKGIKTNANSDLYETTEDIKAISYLGKYYAYKILAATNLHFFKVKGDSSFHKAMISELNLSSYYWRYYASTALAHYKNPLWTNRVGYVDWRNIYEHTLQDLIKQGGKINLPSMEPTDNGKVLEAEGAIKKNVNVESSTPGFTGLGYAISVNENNQLQWTFDAPKSGKYILEFRYLKSDSIQSIVPVLVRKKPVGNIIFWNGGGDKNWVWDRLAIPFTKGKNDISISIANGILVDHLNVIEQ